MHVGLIIYGSLDTLSGGYLYDRKLVAYLREHGDTVTVLSQPWVNYGRHVLHNFDGQLRAQLQAHMRTQPFDVLLQDELNHPSLFLLNRAIRKDLLKTQGSPIISIVHHLRCSEARPAWQNAHYRQIERRYLNSVDGFIFNSQTTRQTVFAVAGQAQTKPHVVALPAGDRFGAGLSAHVTLHTHGALSPLRLLFVGNIIPRKGLHVVLAALTACPGPWQLDIIGSATIDTAYAQRLRAQVAQLGLSEHVRWLGRASDEALAEAFRQHEVLVGPSTYEGYGIVYLEAMGFGLPVIASTGGAAHEIVTDGMDGFLVDPDDATTLAARINTLIAEPHTRQRLSQAARQRYQRHPTWSQSLAQIQTFLKGL